MLCSKPPAWRCTVVVPYGGGHWDSGVYAMLNEGLLVHSSDSICQGDHPQHSCVERLERAFLTSSQVR
jgi:hypothetical protein